MIIMEQQKRIIGDVLTYTKVFYGKIDEYIGAINQGITTQEEFKKYLRESIMRINLVLKIIKNLEKNTTEATIDNTNKGVLLEHIKEIYTHWKSTAQIINGISKAEKILSVHKKFEVILDRNKKRILMAGDKLSEKIITLSRE